jgi:hypothetical protein
MAQASSNAGPLADQDRSQASAGFEQLGCLRADDAQVIGLVQRCVVHVHQLQDFAFGNDVGGVREDLHHPHVVGFDHHLESAGVQEIADQDTRGVAEGLVGCRAPTPQGGFVHHVVVEQCGRVDELDDRSQVETLAALVAEGATGQQHNTGLSRLPPAEMMYRATSPTSGTPESSRRAMTCPLRACRRRRVPER